MLARSALAVAALLWLLAAAPAPSPTPSPNAEGERIFARAKDFWRTRTDTRYVRYGALVRYLHDGHVFDNWWDAYYRSSDDAMALNRLVDDEADRRRLRGIPFSIFGVKIFDTNPDAEPIRIDEPRISPADSFGVLSRAAPRPTPLVPNPRATDEFREISRVEANARQYQVTLAGTERVLGAPALHLKLEPLRDPKLNRLRDLWLDPATYRTVQSSVQGLLSGQPYDAVRWTVRYVVLDGREYVQQIYADEPLRFGLDTIVPKFEFDFVDYHFPNDVPQFTFDRPF